MSPSAPSDTRDPQVFADPSVNGSVFQNFAALSSSEAVARIIAFGGMLNVARRVGAANYGVIAFVSGLTLYLAKIADFGIDTISTVEIAKRRDEVSRFGSAILGMRFTLTVALTLATIGGAQIWLPEPERTVLSMFAVLVMAVALWISREAHVVWQLTAAAAAYALALLSVGRITFHHGMPALAV